MPGNKNVESECCIHTETSKSKEEPLTAPKDVASWNTLLEAAKIRKHEKLLDIAKDLDLDEKPDIVYHRTCRSRFTLLRDLQNLKHKQERLDTEDELDEPPMKRTSQRSSSSDDRIYPKECIFKKTCGNNKRIKGTTTCEKLIPATELRVDHKLHHIAIMKGNLNLNILLLINLSLLMPVIVTNVYI